MILVSFLGGCQKQIITLNSKCILSYIQRTQRTQSWVSLLMKTKNVHNETGL